MVCGKPARRQDRDVRQLAGHVCPEIARQVLHHEVAECAELRPQQCEGLVDLEASRVVFRSDHPGRVTAGREERRVDVELAVEHVQLGVLEVEQGVVVGHDGCRRLPDVGHPRDMRDASNEHARRSGDAGAVEDG